MLDELWQTTLAELELLISKANFTTWFKNTYISNYENNIVVVATPNAFTKAWLEKKYHPQIFKALNNITNNDIKKVDYIVETKQNQSVNQPVSQKPKLDAIQPRIENSSGPTISSVNAFGLNTKYVFSTFIVGSGNELAHAASKAISEKPGKLYNPLFIYGGVGLGKTHLAQAVGNKILEDNPKAKILYINSEKFTNDFVQAIKNGSIDQFKRDYRNVDALIIDDIQFIAGKEQTQEEFFHTFNELRDKGKQIILTADRLPKDIPAIEQRLVSRFEWGMVADVGAPSLETRIAILKTKLAKSGINLDNEIVQYVAENVVNNIRELEGAMNKIIVYQQIESNPITLNEVKELLVSIVNAKKKTVSVRKIAECVANFYSITMDDLIKQSRRKEYAKPRQAAMYLTRKELGSSFPSIGEFFGGRDHTTVMHGVEKVEKAVNAQDQIKQELDLILEKIYS